MNSFHELNTMTSRGDIKSAFALIREWPENIARKIMKKAGYSVPSHTGRAFWLWVQQTLIQASREKRCGYQQRFSRSFSRVRLKAENYYDEYARMMAEQNRECEPEFPSERVVNLERIAEPATTGPVTVSELRKIVCEDVTHETENRRIVCIVVTRLKSFKTYIHSCVSTFRAIFKNTGVSLSKRHSVLNLTEAICFHYFREKYDKNRLVDEVQALSFNRYPGNRLRTPEVRR
ncbi:hypothetical protein [Pantoea sp. At-9b]|uniref:hypothetical protein n=1 Tax=Pantoea sp. (strain At-9b) TaxID=592316 RepID=UPI0001B3FB83|nr:hypothetical protein [Pantoea sp. At-9b]